MQQQGHNRRGLSILLIDDDAAVRDSVGPLLIRLGHRVTAVGSGEEGVRQLERGAEADIVLLDLNMPGLGGAGTLIRIRALRPELAIILATGSDVHAEPLILGDPKVRLLEKPFHLTALRQLLDETEKTAARSTPQDEC